MVRIRDDSMNAMGVTSRGIGINAWARRVEKALVEILQSTPEQDFDALVLAASVGDVNIPDERQDVAQSYEEAFSLEEAHEVRARLIKQEAAILAGRPDLAKSRADTHSSRADDLAEWTHMSLWVRDLGDGIAKAQQEQRAERERQAEAASKEAEASSKGFGSSTTPVGQVRMAPRKTPTVSQYALPEGNTTRHTDLAASLPPITPPEAAPTCTTAPASSTLDNTGPVRLPPLV